MYRYIYVLILNHIWKIYSDFTVTSLEFSEKKYGGSSPDGCMIQPDGCFFSGFIKQLMVRH